MGLDATDLRMARVALNYYVPAWRLCKRPVPPAATLLAEHLDALMAASGPESQVPQEQWITTAEAAHRTGYSERHIRRLAPRIGRRIGRVWAIRADALPQGDS
jgi:hypothetical protein